MSQALTQPRVAFSLPIFLAPAFSETRPVLHIIATRAFSSSCSRGQNQKSKKVKDANKRRGVSALRSTGLRKPLEAYKFPLPQPAKDAAQKIAEIPGLAIRQDHGLYQFFPKDRSRLLTPLEEDVHGRAWTEKELARKSFDDLWKLHWVCVKEINSIKTRQAELIRLRAGFGASESGGRLAEVQKTMQHIREVLIDRYDDYTNSQRLVLHKDMRDIFPDAESSIGLGKDSGSSFVVAEYDDNVVVPTATNQKS